MQTKIQLPARISRIVLVGFMGAGKSTVGALLARQLQWRFLDADQVLEGHAGTSIAEIFVQQGEAVFRRMEAALIGDLIREKHLVLAIGGGAIETESARNALLLAPETCVVFLEAPLEVMISRCELQDRERLRHRFESRLPHYRNAHLVVETASLTPEQTSQHIVSIISALLKEKTLA
jgi:shikimate kinase